MAVWLDLEACVYECYHNTTSAVNYTGYTIYTELYINWDNYESNTTGAKVNYQIGTYKAYGTGTTFNKNGLKKGRQSLGGYSKRYSTTGANEYVGSDIVCKANYEGISDTSYVQRTVPGITVHSGLRCSKGTYEFLERNQFVLGVTNDLGATNRKWEIRDRKGNVILSKSISNSSTSTVYYKLTESDLNKLYQYSYWDDYDKCLAVDAQFVHYGTYNGKTYTAADTGKILLDGKHPTVSYTIIDSDATTVALTGDNTSFIRYFSDININAVWTAYNEATISSRSIKYNVNNTVTDTNTASAVNISEAKVVLSATDSRNLSTTITVNPNIVLYTKLTCAFFPTMTLDGNVSFSTSGNFYNHSFGAVNNVLTLQYRYKKTGGNYGDWITITPTLNGDYYSGAVSFTIPDFAYQDTFVFQVRATDKLMTVETPEYTVNATPIFDWGKNDFAFNVPVTIKGKPVYVEELLYFNEDLTDKNSVILSESFNNFDYLEIYYYDNNANGHGYTKVYKPYNNLNLHLSLIQHNSDNGFYIRDTWFKFRNDNEIYFYHGGYHLFSTSALTKYSTANNIKIYRVTGLRGLNV